MPLISTEPTELELPDLKLVGACSFADFLSNQHHLFGETWERYYADPVPEEHRAHPNRSFSLDLFPPEFPKDARWYYFAGVEVKDLEIRYPSSLVSRFIPAARYLRFTIAGPVTEIGPAHQYIYEQWLPNSGVKLAGYYDLEFYDERFTGPTNADSLMDLLLPVS